MNRRDDKLDRVLDGALAEIRNEAPDRQIEQAASERVWQKLGRELEQATAREAEERRIRGCEDFQALIPDHVSGRLAGSRALLVQDHLGECVPCRRALRQFQKAERIAATQPQTRKTGRAATWGWRVAAAAAIFVTFIGVSLETDVFSFESGGVIRIESVDGELFRVTEQGTTPLAAGDEITLARGEGIRTAKDSTAMLALADNSRLEMRERSELAVMERHHLLPGRQSDGVIELERGSVIIEASDRGSGHLYVDTDDCRVAVTGTVFSVSHGMKGSRVSVVEGEVQVNYRGTEDVLQPGQQVTTTRALRRVPVAQDIAWSRNSAEYIQLMEEMRVLGREIDEILRPGLRYDTTLLDRAPASTVVYIAMPNISEELDQAYDVLQQRVAASEVLADWWAEQVAAMGADEHIEQTIEKIRNYGDHLGEEVALMLQVDADGNVTAPLFVAEVDAPEALVDMLQEELATLRQEFGANADVRVIEGRLPTIAPEGPDELIFWTQGDILAVSPKIEQLWQLDAALAGHDGTRMAGSAFHDRLTELYAEGVEWAVGIDLERVLASENRSGDQELERMGLSDVQHFIASRKQTDNRTENSAVLTFDGPRRNLASWLAEPAPMGSMDYISPDANLAVAFVMKDARVLVEELFSLIGEDDAEFDEQLSEFERQKGISILDDIASPLGGEFALAVDGPLLPTPSWKLIMEVYDPATLVDSLQWLVDHVNQEMERQAGEPVLALSSEQIGGREYFRLESLQAGVAAHFVFDNGYLVAGPTTGLIDRALKNREMQITLVDSPGFTELLPLDGRVNFSGVLYQNLGPVLEPVTATLSGTMQLSEDDSQILESLAREAKPSLALLYGEEDRIIFSATTEGGLLTSGLNSLTGVGSLFGMQQSVANLMHGVHAAEAQTSVRHDVRTE